ncbi:hypothetical protein [Engelhardtia mirabilis]|uniref:Uncharacterized protein n=1 Tax=Engelhardtia mirabilis TaxID=2528011 RepID=A0A518BSX8_9BACT|nr:hypothetical protein Pla133_51960 [Planctomycetes bacterium Pla133]QDV04398.1 hypothetical protein Pla86_51930 [Planctomycetes bacterium Pla86]
MQTATETRQKIVTAISRDVSHLRDRLARTRDELRLEAHLGAKELEDRRGELDRQRRDLADRIRAARGTAAKGASRVGSELTRAWEQTLEACGEVQEELTRRGRS